jgi:L-threonylcarbamoyladenylate synthase
MANILVFDINLAEKLKRGKYAVFATDTVYGIHTSALSESAVNKLYEIRGRAPEKPFIILIGSIDQISEFGISIDSETLELLNEYWPGQVSIILPCLSDRYEYLHRGTKSLAFRLPDKESLRQLLLESGPLISTSVNPEGKTPAKNIEEAKEYFGDRINYYFDEGEKSSPPSTLISIKDGKVEVIREGAVKIK